MQRGRAGLRARTTAFLILLAAASPAAAAIIGGEILSGRPGAQFIKLEIPFDESTPASTVGSNNFQSIHLYGFDEDQNFELTEPLTVDAVPSGSTTLPAGMRISSHYVFFDPLTVASIDGFVNFDANIVGVLASRALLRTSDFLGNENVAYTNPSARGLEAGQDSVTITGARQIRFAARASSPGDYIRILTQIPAGDVRVPEPSSAALLFSGIAIVALSRWRRKARGRM